MSFAGGGGSRTWLAPGCRPTQAPFPVATNMYRDRSSPQSIANGVDARQVGAHVRARQQFGVKRSSILRGISQSGFA
jgi:hypothetical protein